MYEIYFSDRAKKEVIKLKKDELSAFNKLNKLLKDIKAHPRTGIGKPEQLGGNRAGQWSRRISSRHRLVYEIHDNIIEVYVLSCIGHYDEK
jgi:toxin YoeB